MIDKLAFWRSDNSDERPPKPESDTRTTEKELTVYEVEIEYRNGETETFESYGVRQDGSDRIVFNTEIYARKRFSYDNADMKFGYNTRSVHYEVLSREPKQRELRTEGHRITYTVGHELKYENISWEPTTWKETIEDCEMEQVA